MAEKQMNVVNAGATGKPKFPPALGGPKAPSQSASGLVAKYVNWMFSDNTRDYSRLGKETLVSMAARDPAIRKEIASSMVSSLGNGNMENPGSKLALAAEVLNSSGNGAVKLLAECLDRTNVVSYAGAVRLLAQIGGKEAFAALVAERDSLDSARTDAEYAHPSSQKFNGAHAGNVQDVLSACSRELHAAMAKIDLSAVKALE